MPQMAATIPGTAMMAMLCFVALALPADADISDQNCTGVHVAGKDFLDGEHLRIGFVVNDVTVKCNENALTPNPCLQYGSIDRETNKVYAEEGDFTDFKVWTGFDIDLIEELARIGNFNYTIVSMGNGGDTDGGDNFTGLAWVMLGHDNTNAVPGGPVDVIGQGDWLHDKTRQNWAIWTSPVLTSDVLLLTKPPVYLPPTPSETMMTDPFTNQVWWNLFWIALVASFLFWCT